MNLKQIYRGCLSGLIFSTVALPVMAEETFWFQTPERLQKFASMNPEDLVRIPVSGNWLFVAGKPKTGWADKIQAGKTFKLEQTSVDLQKIASAAEYSIGEAVLYYEFESSKDGIAQLGMASNWFFESRCNGILCYSTMKSGNWYSLEYSPMNHPFFFPVKKGKNLLAVHTKKGKKGWTFFCGTIPFVMPTAPVLVHQPNLMWPDRDNMSVGFLTCGKIGAGIEYRAKNDKTWKIVWDHRYGQIIWREFHPVTLTGLQPGVEYVYRAVMINKYNPLTPWVRSREYTFRMPLDNEKKFSFFFTADLQFSYPVQKKLLQDLLKYAHAETCDFIVLGGDIGSWFDPDHIVRNIFPLLPAQKPLIYMRGNHELRAIHDSMDPSCYYDYFAMPNGRSYGMFRFGNTAFMMLDSWEDRYSSAKSYYCKYNVDSAFYLAQLNYIKPIFKSQEWLNAERKIVFCHSAPYSHAGGSLIPNFLKKIIDDDLKGKIPKSRLNLWISGHKHLHMRSIPGTNEVAAAEKPIEAAYGGTDYIFPVLTVGGPIKRSPIKASAYRVDCSEKGIRVRAYADSGTLLEELFYANNGELTATKELKHYTYTEKPYTRPKNPVLR